jgi:hypothetical protein
MSRRLWCSMTTSTYSTRNVLVTATRKSQAITPRAWLRRKVDHRWPPLGRPGAGRGMYFATVRGPARCERHTEKNCSQKTASYEGKHAPPQPSAITSSGQSRLGLFFTRGPVSTRGAIHRVLLRHDPSKSSRVDAERSTTARPSSREDRGRLAPMPNVGARDSNALPTV